MKARTILIAALALLLAACGGSDPADGPAAQAEKHDQLKEAVIGDELRLKEQAENLDEELQKAADRRAKQADDDGT